MKILFIGGIQDGKWHYLSSIGTGGSVRFPVKIEQSHSPYKVRPYSMAFEEHRYVFKILESDWGRYQFMVWDKINSNFDIINTLMEGYRPCLGSETKSKSSQTTTHLPDQPVQ